MPDVASRMRAQRTRDTKPELALRRELHRRGLRFRVDECPLPGGRWRADIVFSRAKVAVFVDGCFWHGCPDHGVAPKNNAAWWARKLSANQARDERVCSELEAAGWCCVRVWEHESAEAVADRVEQLVLRRRGIRAV